MKVSVQRNPRLMRMPSSACSAKLANMEMKGGRLRCTKTSGDDQKTVCGGFY